MERRSNQKIKLCVSIGSNTYFFSGFIESENSDTYLFLDDKEGLIEVARPFIVWKKELKGDF